MPNNKTQSIMDNIKIDNAQQAATEKEKRAVNVSGILNLIGMNVGQGYFIQFGYMPNNVLSELINRGFTITKCIGHLGEPITRIEW